MKSISQHFNLSHDMTKPTKWVCAQRRLTSAWASAQSDQFSLCAQWVAKDPMFLHADSEDSDQTGRMSRKTQVSLVIRPVWSESSLCAQWVAKDPRFLLVDNEDSDQIGRMSRLIWVFVGRTHTSLVLWRRGSFFLQGIQYG